MTLSLIPTLLHALLFVMFPWLGLTLPAQPEAREASPPDHALPIHSHNDYYRDRPLLDALDAGCRSIEADVWLEDQQIRVGHEKFELTSARTLELMYLYPLSERVRTTGSVYPGQPEDEPVLLLVDFKHDGEATHDALRELLADYTDMLTITENGQTRWGPVWVVVSGDRPIEAIEADSPRLMAIDGRPDDLTGDKSATLVPLISQRWGSLFEWDGKGEMPESDLAKLREIVGAAHEQGRIVRFWAIPDKPEAWTTLRELGVDLINTDRPAACAEVLGGGD